MRASMRVWVWAQRRVRAFQQAHRHTCCRLAAAVPPRSVGGVIGGQTRKQQMAEEHGGDVHEAYAEMGQQGGQARGERTSSARLQLPARCVWPCWRGALQAACALIHSLPRFVLCCSLTCTLHRL